MEKNKLNGLSLFACAGIGEYYLEKNGIDVVVANELLEDRCKFYSGNYPNSEMICGDITDKSVFNKVMKASIEKKVDFIMATPPCQGFSTAGKMEESDPRNSLFIKVIDSIKKIKPKYAIIENVPNFFKHYIKHHDKDILALDLLSEEISKEYNICYAVVNAADYGTPQNRKRAIILISRKGLSMWAIPSKTVKEPKTVRQTIGHLPSIESGQDSGINLHKSPVHNDRHILWMKNTPTGKSAFENPVHYPQKAGGEVIKGFKNTYKRIEWDKPAPTITMANGVISSQENVHPGRKKADGTYSDARVLSIHEIMLLTGLDDKWKIPSWAKDSLIRHVIGESVPPLLFFELTKPLKKILKG